MSEKKYKVLIVDDDKFLLDIYAIKFKAEGFEVDTAASGEDAIRKLTEAEKKFQIILLDMVMPGMDGEAILSEIKKKGLDRDLVKIVLSNQGEPEDIKKAEAYKVDGYIVKASAIPSEVLEEVEKIADDKLGN